MRPLQLSLLLLLLLAHLLLLLACSAHVALADAAANANANMANAAAAASAAASASLRASVAAALSAGAESEAKSEATVCAGETATLVALRPSASAGSALCVSTGFSPVPDNVSLAACMFGTSPSSFAGWFWRGTSLVSAKTCKCLSASVAGPRMAPCDAAQAAQQWTWDATTGVLSSPSTTPRSCVVFSAIRDNANVLVVVDGNNGFSCASNPVAVSSVA